MILEDQNIPEKNQSEEFSSEVLFLSCKKKRHSRPLNMIDCTIALQFGITLSTNLYYPQVFENEDLCESLETNLGEI